MSLSGVSEGGISAFCWRYVWEEAYLRSYNERLCCCPRTRYVFQSARFIQPTHTEWRWRVFMVRLQTAKVERYINHIVGMAGAKARRFTLMCAIGLHDGVKHNRDMDTTDGSGKQSMVCPDKGRTISSQALTNKQFPNSY